jgi:integrase/recombinase XerD
MTDECISPLRRRMIEDRTVRTFVVKTQTDYIRRIKSFAVFLAAALFQVPRLAKARNMLKDRARQLVETHVKGRTLSVSSARAARVNVLALVPITRWAR